MGYKIRINRNIIRGVVSTRETEGGELQAFSKKSQVSLHLLGPRGVMGGRGGVGSQSLRTTS